MPTTQRHRAEPLPRPSNTPGQTFRDAARLPAFEWIPAAAIFFLTAVGLQWKAGAFAVEFGSHPDESAHYVTGLMIRDYIVSIASGRITSPLAYAENYYVHYPKVAIGMWPPFFHFTEAVWSLIFSPGRISILLLMALITAAIATSIFLVLRRNYPILGAFVSGALFLALPLVQTSAHAVMADSLVALLDFWAMIFMIAYLDHERTRDAVLAGVFAALSMATKANGVALLLLPTFVVLITQRFHLLRQRGLYYAGGVILVLGVPWQLLSYYLITHSQTVPPDFLQERFALGLYYGKVLFLSLGWGLAPFFLLGTAVFLIRQWRGRPDTTLACALALVLSVWAYHSILLFGEDRYLLGALPPAILFIAAGFAWTVQRISLLTNSPVARSTLLGALAIGVFALQPWAVPRKPYQGFDQPARFLSSAPEFADDNFLVVSDAMGEGAFISEVAMREQRPDHIILRASKFLSSSRWNGTNYQLRFQSDAELRDFLDHAPIDAVILDTRTGQSGDLKATSQLEEQVAQVLVSNPNWRYRDNYPKLTDHSPWIKLYTRVGARPPGDIRLDMRYTLSHDIVYTESNQAREHSAATH